MPRKKAIPPFVPAAIAVPHSDNRKTGPVSVTYVSQASCPVTCPFLGCGCYAENGPTAIILARCDAGGVGLTPEQLAAQEAIAIDRLPRGSDLRLHVVGDCRTNKSAAIVAAAAMRLMKQSAGFRVNDDFCRAWTYTHAFYSVNRSSWASVSVLASCETWEEVDIAYARGYAAAIVVEEFENGDKAWHVTDGDGGNMYTAVPCLFQTKEIQCRDCRLCLDDEKLRAERRVIAFKAQGSRRETVVRTLRVLNGDS